MDRSHNHKDSAAQRDFKAALARAPYGDDAMVGEMTAAVVGKGHAILQIHKLAVDDRAHVNALLELFDPPHGALILDAGCGIGRVAELMVEKRPDLRFTLLNISPSQIALCPPGFPAICADFHETGLPAASIDAIMFAYSLGHGLLDRAFREASRLLRPGGIVFIYDLTADRPEKLIEALGYKPHRLDDLLAAGAQAGMVLSFSATPEKTTTADFVALVGPAYYAETFSGVTPLVCRFTKC